MIFEQIRESLLRLYGINSSFFVPLFPSPFTPLSLPLPLPLPFLVHNEYTPHDSDDDLCTVIRRAGCHDEKIVFIMEECNVFEQ